MRPMTAGLRALSKTFSRAAGSEAARTRLMSSRAAVSVALHSTVVGSTNGISEDIIKQTKKTALYYRPGDGFNPLPYWNSEVPVSGYFMKSGTRISITSVVLYLPGYEIHEGSSKGQAGPNTDFRIGVAFKGKPHPKGLEPSYPQQGFAMLIPLSDLPLTEGYEHTDIYGGKTTYINGTLLYQRPDDPTREGDGFDGKTVLSMNCSPDLGNIEDFSCTRWMRAEPTFTLAGYEPGSVHVQIVPPSSLT